MAQLARAPVSKTGDSRFESWLPRLSAFGLRSRKIRSGSRFLPSENAPFSDLSFPQVSWTFGQLVKYFSISSAQAYPLIGSARTEKLIVKRGKGYVLYDESTDRAADGPSRLRRSAGSQTFVSLRLTRCFH